MKFSFILLFFFIASCAPKGELIKSTFNIQSDKKLTAEQESQLSNQLLSRLNNHGFNDSKIEISGNQVMVTSRVDLVNEKNLYTALFQSNKLELWNTFRLTDPQISNIDSADLELADFTPFYKLENGFLSREIIGICKNENKLDSVVVQLSEKLKDIDNLKLVWSENNKMSSIDGRRNSSELYMINTKGKQVAPIQESDIAEVSVVKSNYSNYYDIRFKLSKSATQKWGKMTQDAAYDDNRSIAILINDRVIAVPRVMGPIISGDCSVSGNYIQEEAQQLATSFKLGRLDYTLVLINQQPIVE